MNPPLGWQCPCCLVVYAPSVMKCECKKVGQKPKTDNEGLDKFKKLAEERDMNKARLKERPFYPPPPPMELAPPMPSKGPYCSGEMPPNFHMKARSGHNRAICKGDQGRFDLNDGAAPKSIRAKVASWDTDFLSNFLFKCKSAPWRAAAQAEIYHRLLPKTKQVHKKQRSKAPKTPSQIVSHVPAWSSGGNSATVPG